jgi:hypothetical protein
VYNLYTTDLSHSFSMDAKNSPVSLAKIALVYLSFVW